MFALQYRLSRHILTAGLIALSFSAPPATAEPVVLTAEQRAYLHNLGPITVSPDPDWMPFEYVDEAGNFTGIAADLLTLLEARLGIIFTYVHVNDWTEAVQLSRNGEVLILPFLNQTPAREEWLAFTEPLLIDPNVFITRSDHPYIYDARDLNDRILVLPRGTSIEERVRRDFPNLGIKLVETEDEVFQAIEDGEADLTLRSLTVSAYTIRNRGYFNLRINGQAPDEYVNHLRMGILNSEPMLRDILNLGIATITSREREEIVTRHVNITIITPFDYTRLWQLGSVLLAGLALSWFWALRLRRSKKALAESERSKSTLLRNLPGMAYRCRMDSDWSMEFVSEGVYDLTGYTAEDLLQNRTISFNELILPQHRTHIQRIWKDAVHLQQKVQVEYQIRTASEEIKWVYEQGCPIYDHDGQVTHLEGFITDITDRIESRQALEREKTRLNAIIEGANIGTWEWNIVTGEVLFNERWADIVGYRLDELAPASLQTWKDLVHPNDGSMSDALLAKHFSRELDFYEIEVRMRHKQGHWVWVQARGKVATWTADGKPLLMMGTHLDSTARKQLEDQLKHHSMFQELIASIATRFLSFHDSLPEEKINYFLGRCGRHLHVDHVYVCEFAPSHDMAAITYEWSAPESGAMKPQTRPLPLTSFPLASRLLQDRAICFIQSVERMPDTEQADREMLLLRRVQSALRIPLLDRDQICGYLGIDSIRRPLEISIHQRDMLQLLGELLLHALQLRDKNDDNILIFHHDMNPAGK